VLHAPCPPSLSSPRSLGTTGRSHRTGTTQATPSTPLLDRGCKRARLAWRARGQRVRQRGKCPAGMWAQGTASGRPSQARQAESARGHRGGLHRERRPSRTWDAASTRLHPGGSRDEPRVPGMASSRPALCACTAMLETHLVLRGISRSR
jgi:hypothetical protein